MGYLMWLFTHRHLNATPSDENDKNEVSNLILSYSNDSFRST
jgi:hypothetical protein